MLDVKNPYGIQLLFNHVKIVPSFYHFFCNLTYHILLQILFRLWASGDQSLSLSAFLMIREVAALLPDCLDLCLTKAYNTYLASTKLVNDRNTKHIDFLMNCLVELYSLDVQKSCERAVTSVGQLNAILRQASKTKEKVCNSAYIWTCMCTFFLTPDQGYEVLTVSFPC